MMFEDMNERQHADEALFVELLQQSGWDVEPFASLLRDGVLVTPEGNASLEIEESSLTLEYYAENGEVVLIIALPDGSKIVRIKLIPRDGVEAVVRWVIKHQSSFTPTSFTGPLREIYPECNSIWMLGNDGSTYKIEM